MLKRWIFLTNQCVVSTITKRIGLCEKPVFARQTNYYVNLEHLQVFSEIHYEVLVIFLRVTYYLTPTAYQ
jgi:hypothetical protein